MKNPTTPREDLLKKATQALGDHRDITDVTNYVNTLTNDELDDWMEAYGRPVFVDKETEITRGNTLSYQEIKEKVLPAMDEAIVLGGKRVELRSDEGYSGSQEFTVTYAVPMTREDKVLTVQTQVYHDVCLAWMKYQVLKNQFSHE